LPFIIIKSHGRDKYGRYLADIFYLKGEKDPQAVLNKGIFLNQQLLDENLAQREY
jgi:endonuclease YncB( thermonuclease family)